MADGIKQKANERDGVSRPLSSPAPLFELVRLLARHAARQDSLQRETKDDDHHDQAD